MANPIVWWEFMSKEPQKVAAFYEKCFGWTVEEKPEMNYRFLKTGGSLDGGLFKPEQQGPWAGNLVMYIQVDDLAAFRKKVAAAGGKIHVEEQQAPGMGAFSLFTDPDGRMMGLWKSAK